MENNNLEHDLEYELKQIFSNCPLSQDNKANINDLLDQLSIKYGINIVELLRKEIGLCSNIVEDSVSFDDFVALMRDIILVNTEDNLNVDFIPSEFIENGNNTSNEEFVNHNELNSSNSIEDVKYWRDSKKAIDEKLLKAETAVQTLEDSLKNCIKKNIQLNKDIEIMREDANRLQLAENENEELKEKLKNLEIRYKHKNDNLKKVLNRIETLEGENLSLSGKVNKLQRDLDKKITLLNQTEQCDKALYEEINRLKHKNAILIEDVKKNAVNSDINKDLLKRINDLMNDKASLQIQISEFELTNVTNNFDHLNPTVMDTPCDQNNSKVSIRSELSGIYDHETEVFNKMEKIASSITMSTQTKILTNNVCSQTDIVPEPFSESSSWIQTPKMPKHSKPKNIFQEMCDDWLVQEMELCDDELNQLGTISQSCCGQNDQTFNLPNLELTCAINPSINQCSFGQNETVDLRNLETAYSTDLSSNKRHFVQNDQETVVYLPKLETTCTINPSKNQSYCEQNDLIVALPNMENTICLTDLPSKLSTYHNEKIPKHYSTSTPLQFIKASDSSHDYSSICFKIDDRSSKPYSYSFFSYADPRAISKGLFPSLIYLVHEMIKFGKKFNIFSLMIIFFSILAYFAFSILFDCERCRIYGYDIQTYLTQNWGFKVTYPHGRAM